MTDYAQSPYSHPSMPGAEPFLFMAPLPEHTYRGTAAPMVWVDENIGLVPAEDTLISVAKEGHALQAQVPAVEIEDIDWSTVKSRATIHPGLRDFAAIHHEPVGTPIFDSILKDTLLRLAKRRDAELESWLQGVIEDPEGRKLVKDILDRKEASLRAEAIDRLFRGESA